MPILPEGGARISKINKRPPYLFSLSFSLVIEEEIESLQVRLRDPSNANHSESASAAKSPAWRGYMAARTGYEWIYALRAATLETVKALLNAEDLPSFEYKKVLPWAITSHFGVYGRAVWGIRLMIFTYMSVPLLADMASRGER